MDKAVTENIFVLEFLVENIEIFSCSMPQRLQECCNFVLCVSFKFLDNKPMHICGNDFASQSEASGLCKNGKSCLFSLSPERAQEAVKEFDVDVQVYAKLPNEHVQLGKVAVPVVDLFRDLIRSMTANIEKLPPAQSLRDCFSVVNPRSKAIGYVSVFIRLSCYGKLIVTQIQMNLDEKSVLFKDNEGRSMYKYRRIKSTKSISHSAKTPRACPRSAMTIDSRNRPMSAPVLPDMMKPCQPCPMNNYGRGSNFGDNDSIPNRSRPCTPTSVVQEPIKEEIQNPPNLKGSYEEISAKMNSNSITIKIHTKGIDEEEPQPQPTEQNCKNCKCNCKCGGKGYEVQQSNYVPGGPPCYCLAKELAMRPGDSSYSPMGFKLTGDKDATGGADVTVMPPISATTPNEGPDGGIPDTLDPKNVFVLKVKKKKEKGGKSKDKKVVDNLDLQFITPKVVGPKPPPRKATRNTQYRDEDCPPTGGKDKKEKKPRFPLDFSKGYGFGFSGNGESLGKRVVCQPCVPCYPCDPCPSRPSLRSRTSSCFQPCPSYYSQSCIPYPSRSCLKSSSRICDPSPCPRVEFMCPDSSNYCYTSSYCPRTYSRTWCQY